MKIYSLGAAIAALVVLCGCEMTQPTQSAPPPEVARYDARPLPPGTRLTFRRKSDALDTSESFVVEAPVTYQGRPALKLVSGDGSSEYLDAATTNWMASYDVDGKLTTSASPHNGRLDFPLWVGKKWRSTYDFTNHEENRTWYGMSPSREAVALETVTTPAGTFETIRIESGPGKGVGFRETVWYAPDIGVSVKRVSERTRDHYRGPGGRTESVLIAYDEPAS